MIYIEIEGVEYAVRILDRDTVEAEKIPADKVLAFPAHNGETYFVTAPEVAT